MLFDVRKEKAAAVQKMRSESENRFGEHSDHTHTFALIKINNNGFQSRRSTSGDARKSSPQDL